MVRFPGSGESERAVRASERQPATARNLVRFPGSGAAESERPARTNGHRPATALPASAEIRGLLNELARDRGERVREAPDTGTFLGQQSIWFKLTGVAALLYGAYLIGWASAEPAQRTLSPELPLLEIAVTVPPPVAVEPPPLEIAVTMPPPVAVEPAPAAEATDKPEPLIPPAPPPPLGLRRLSNEELLEAQAKLQALGYDPGPVDGFHGSQTVSAVKRYEIARQIEPTGNVDLRLLERLRQEP